MTTLDKINWLLEDQPVTVSQRSFLTSVAKQITRNPLVFPSTAQAELVDRLFRHYQPEAIKQAKEALGL